MFRLGVSARVERLLSVCRQLDIVPASPSFLHPSHSNCLAMDTIGLTLRSKSRRPRPQISHPKPISGPLPANSKAAGPSAKAASRGTRERSGSTTSDLVKRRYSTRFNQPPDIDAQAPPVPDLSQVKGEYATDASRTGKIAASTDPSQPIPVDLKALQDPSLPVDRCESSI